MELVEGAEKDEGIRTKDKERPTGSKPEPAASPRLPGPRPPLPPPEFYIPEQLLPRALSALPGEDLAQFRRELCRFSPSLRVSQAQVEAAGVAELRDLLLCNYSLSDALQKAEQALEKTPWQRQGEWHTFGTKELWISSCLGYALEGLDGDDLERFKRKLFSSLRLGVIFFEEELEIIKDVPQLCRLMLTKRGWFGALLLSAVILEGINRKDEAGWLRLVEKRSHGPQIVLQRALQTLERGDLQKFKKSLLHFHEQQDSDSAFKGLAEGERRVKLFEDLEPVDADELSKSLISSYGSFAALEMAADVLETINQKRLAGWLRLCLAAPDPWECLEDTLVSLGKKELQKLKHDFFPSPLFLTVNWATVEAADVSKLCHLLRDFCGDFVALDVASEILEAIGQKHQADWLRLGMVGFNLQKCLDCVLQHLGQEKWERFKDKLHDHRREMGCDPLPTWTGYRTKTLEFFDLLTQSDVSQLGRKLIKFYGVKDVLEVVTKVLDAMNEKSEADWLRMWMEEQNAWRHLKDAFSNLGEENLERFRCKVLQLSENKGLPSVPKIWMKGTTIPQFIKVIFSFYGQGAALEMVGEALKTIDRVSSSTMTDLYQYLVQIYGSPVSPSVSLISEEKMSGKMKSPADLGKNCVCKRCPSETLREPASFWNSQRKREIYRLYCTKAGSFCCRYTGLIFEVTKAVTIQYWSDSWKKWQYLWNTQDLTIAGSLFGLDELPLDAVSAIHFPHFLCLEGEDTSQVQIASFLPKGIHLEKPDSVGPFHAVLRNPRFSFFGVVFRKSCFNQKIKAHAMVLLYHIHDTSQFKFHVYLLPNDFSVRKSVHDREMKNPSCRVEKPSWTFKPLTINSFYFLQEFSDISILPKELEFKYLDPELEPQYFELYTLQMPDTLQLKVMEKTKDEPVWEAHVSQDELMTLPLHSVQDVLSRLQMNVYDEVLQLEPAVPSGKKMSKENPTEFQEDCICYMSHSESLTEPDVFWNKQMGHEVYKLHCTKAGSFHCCYTGLIFEVKAAVTIKYWPCSWKKWQNLLNPLSLIIAGPLLYLETCPSYNVTAIHFPHFLCLTGEDSSQVLIARFTSGGMNLLKPDCMDPFHAVLRNPAWYNYGVVVRKSLFNQRIKAHGMVLLYQVLDTSASKFHLYLLPKDYTVRQSVHDREVERHSRRVRKPLRTLKPLKIGSWYILQELAGVFISPKELNFKYVNLELEQQYIELYTEQMSDTLVLKVLEKDEDAPVWEACVGQDELVPPLHSEKGLKQNPVQILGGAVPRLQSPVPSEKKRNGKMENPAGLGENFICSKCPDENLPEKKRPEVVWHPESNQEMYKLCCPGAGSFHCYYTDLIFEAREAVTITYQFDSWKKHQRAIEAWSLMIAGPLLDIQAVPAEAVAAVHFPHFLCLAGEDQSRVLIAHFVGEGMSLERPQRVGSFHAVLENPQFSSRGVVYKNHWLKKKKKFHTIVLLYQVLGTNVPKFHLYLLPNDSSLKKSVEDQEAKNWRIDKPPLTKPLEIGSQVFMPPLDNITVCPKELEFQYMDASMQQQYLELYIKKKQDSLELCLLKKKKDELIWEAYVRQDDLYNSAFLAEQGACSCIKRSGPSDNPALGRSRTHETGPLKQHFIDCHRDQLIQRVRNVHGILDILQQKNILDEEQYRTIFSIRTDTDKMRELYSLVPSWDSYCKDQFYEALKIKDRFLINELEGI